jgi:hypothetical protein
VRLDRYRPELMGVIAVGKCRGGIRPVPGSNAVSRHEMVLGCAGDFAGREQAIADSIAKHFDRFEAHTSDQVRTMFSHWIPSHATPAPPLVRGQGDISRGQHSCPAVIAAPAVNTDGSWNDNDGDDSNINVPRTCAPRSRSRRTRVTWW